MLKRYGVVIGIAIIILAGAIYFSNKKAAVQNAEEAIRIETEVKSTIATAANQDTDGDGLKDWEESLWKTNVKIADTDGDGTSDGQEVNSGRNPIIAGPNDLLQEEMPNTSIGTTTGSAPLTETGILAREIFSQYMSLKQGGAPTSEGDEIAIVTESLNKIVVATPSLYKSEDLTIIATNEANIRAYGNLLANILIKNTTNEKNEIVILRESVDIDDPELIKRLDPIIAGYTEMEKGLKEIPVPEAVYAEHLLFLNAITKLKDTVSNMRLVFDDPIRGMIGVSAYFADSENFFNSYISLRSYFQRNNIIYANTENGSILNIR